MEQNIEHPGAEFLDLPRQEAEEIQAMQIIFRMAEAVTQHISQKKICKCIIDIFIEDTDFENASILLYDTKKDCLRLTAAKGFSEILEIPHKQSYRMDLVFERDEGIAWKVFESQIPMFIENSAKESIPVKPGSKIHPCSLVCLPLWCIGVLNLSSSTPRTFSPYKKRDLAILSNVIGCLLQTTELQDTGPVSMHPSELREILTNLIFNSVDAMPENGTITMRSCEKDYNVVLQIEDNGIGMSKDIKKRVFDPYFTTKDVGSSGLGLSVSFGLIVQAGGTITVDSKEGDGTTFTISLPISGIQKVSETPTAERSETQLLKILAVDDEKQIVDLLATMLEGLGHKIIGVTDGQQALDYLDKEDFDLVITDLGMPVISGWDVAAKAKNKKAGLPVILFTGWGAEYESKDLTEAGIDAILNKPFRLDELTKIILEQCPKK